VGGVFLVGERGGVLCGGGLGGGGGGCVLNKRLVEVECYI